MLTTTAGILGYESRLCPVFWRNRLKLIQNSRIKIDSQYCCIIGVWPAKRGSMSCGGFFLVMWFRGLFVFKRKNDAHRLTTLMALIVDRAKVDKRSGFAGGEFVFTDE